jgi:hypothetical protein
MIQHNKRNLDSRNRFVSPFGLYLCVIAEKRFNQIFLGIVALGVVVTLLPYALLIYDARERLAVSVEHFSSHLRLNIASLNWENCTGKAFIIRPDALTHIPQVRLVELQTICTRHKWCSSLVRITSNSVVQMNYSIFCRVDLRNVGLSFDGDNEPNSTERSPANFVLAGNPTSASLPEETPKNATPTSFSLESDAAVDSSPRLLAIEPMESPVGNYTGATKIVPILSIPVERAIEQGEMDDAELFQFLTDVKFHLLVAQNIAPTINASIPSSEVKVKVTEDSSQNSELSPTSTPVQSSQESDQNVADSLPLTAPARRRKEPPATKREEVFSQFLTQGKFHRKEVVSQASKTAENASTELIKNVASAKSLESPLIKPQQGEPAKAVQSSENASVKAVENAAPAKSFDVTKLGIIQGQQVLPFLLSMPEYRFSNTYIAPFTSNQYINNWIELNFQNNTSVPFGFFPATTPFLMDSPFLELSDPNSEYLKPPTEIDPDKLSPFSTTIPINDLLITHLTNWEFRLGGVFGEQTYSDPNLNSLWKINSGVIQSMSKDKVFSVDQRGEYVQLRTVLDYRQVTTTQTTPLTILGQNIQISLTGGCLFPNKPPGAICTYTPGVEVDQSSINPQTLLPTRIVNTSRLGDIVTPESLAAMRQPGFQTGANGQKIGINLFLPNTGVLTGNSQGSQATLTRQEDFRNAGAASYLYTRQIVQANAEKSVMARTVRGVPIIQDETNTLLNPALSLVNLFLPDIEPNLEASENTSSTRSVSRNLFLAANNTRLPPLSFVIYQASLGEAAHPPKDISDFSQVPEASFNSVWFGLSPVINRRSDVLEGGYNMIGPRRIIDGGGGEGGTSVSDNLEFNSVVNDSTFSSASLTNPYTQVYITFYGQEANVTVKNIYTEETHYYPHLSFTGNITSSNSIFRYYGGVIAADLVKPYIGLDYNQNFGNWNYSIGGIGYLNPDRDYYSQLNGNIAYRIPLQDDTQLTLYSAIAYALQKETRIGDTVSVEPLSSFSTGVRVNAPGVGLAVTNFVGLDNLANNSLSKMLINFSVNLTDYLVLGGYVAPYDENPSRTQYGLNLNLNVDRQYNSPQISFGWANYRYDYGQDGFGNTPSVSDNVFSISFRMGQPYNPYRQPQPIAK